MKVVSCKSVLFFFFLKLYVQRFDQTGKQIVFIDNDFDTSKHNWGKNNR